MWRTIVSPLSLSFYLYQKYKNIKALYRNTVITAWSLLAQKPPERLNGKQDKINQSRCKHKAIYSSFIHFLQNWMAAMDSQLIFAGGINLGSNNRSGLVGWTRGLLGNAFKGWLMGGGGGGGGCFRSTHLPLLSSLSLKGTIYKKVHWLHTESPHKHWNINPFFSSSLAPSPHLYSPHCFGFILAQCEHHRKMEKERSKSYITDSRSKKWDMHGYPFWRLFKTRPFATMGDPMPLCSPCEHIALLPVK